MAVHSFNTEIAKQVGVVAATLYENIVFWTRKSFVNDKHMHDGCVWTYNSVEAWAKLFDYLTPNQIRTAIKKLVDEGLIKEGNYNQSAYDRTKWYGVPIEIHLGKNANGIGQKSKPIPDINTDSNTDNPPISPQGECGFSAEFDAWWKTQYPDRDGSIGSKVKAKKKYIGFRKKGVSKEAIWQATDEYFNELNSRDMVGSKFVKLATTFLNDEPWIK